jgi:hypothetical protein
VRRGWPSSWLGGSALAFAGALSFFLFSLTIADPDLWGHVKFGQDLLAEGQIVRPDPYSFLSGDGPWINHEWLAEALFALVFGAFGSPGLVGLKTGLALLILGLLRWHLGGSGLGPAVVLLGAAGLLLPWFASIRPQLFTYACFLLLLLLIGQAERGRTRWLWAAPVLFAAWANFHGGVLAGLIVLTLWFLAHLLGGPWSPDLARPAATALAAPVAVSFGATLVNPYGVRLLAFLLWTASGARPDIAEWRPIDLMSPYGAAYLAVAAMAGVAVGYSRGPRRIALLLLLPCAALSPFLAVRHVPLFALAVAALAGHHVVDGAKRVASDIAHLSERSTVPAGLGAGALALTAVILVALAVPHFRCIRVRAGEFPVHAIARLQRSGIRGALAIHFDWGQYAIWHVGAKIRVSDDGRRETVYSDQVRGLNDRFTSGTGQWDDLLHRRGVDIALVSKEFPVSNLMRREPGWRLIYEDSLSALFAREGSEAMAEIEKTKPGADTVPAECWPGP